MKQTFLWLIVIMLLAACQEKKGEKITRHHVKAKEEYGKLGITHPVDGMDSLLVKLDSATDMIVRYHKYLKDSLGQLIDSSQLSFTLDANTLRDYLNSNTEIAKLDIYLAHTNTNAMTLVYVGAELIEGSDGEYREMVIVKPDDPETYYVLDHAMPCPKCDKEGIHNQDGREMR